MLGIIKWILEAISRFWALHENVEAQGLMRDGASGSSTRQQVALTNTNGQQSETRIEVDTSAALRRPSSYFLEEERKQQYLNVCVHLYCAALNGDRDTVKGILNENPEALNAAISNKFETALHVAAGANQVHLVMMLVNMEQIDLFLQDKQGNTAFCLAVAAGASQVVEILMQKSADLATTRGGKDMTPLYMAAMFGHNAIALKLYPLTKGVLQERERKWTFFTCIHSGLFDLALKLLQDCPELALALDKQETALHVLAQKPLKFFATESGGILKQILNFILCLRFLFSNKLSKQSPALKLVKELWKQVLLQKRNDKEIKELIRRPTQLLINAAKVGNYDFLVALICSYHDLLWEVDTEGRTIFHIAVLHRHASIFRLIHEIGSIKDIILAIKDGKGNNILHLAAGSPATEGSVVSGAALQMQRELLWFKEVEKIVQPSLREEKNKDNETPQSIFYEKHKKLMTEGESWMKTTAESCTIVAALIATVAFAAAFSVPGGNTSDHGIPIHLKSSLYTIFSLSNATAMFSSSTSILMFLSILTSRYAQRDFLISLPRRLIIGLTSLFFSMATMTIAFCMAFFIAYQGSSTWIPVLIAALQLVPVTLFLYLLFPLLRDIFCSTFLSHSLFKPTKRVLRWAGDT